MSKVLLNSRLSELKKCIVIDSGGTDLGELIDVTLDSRNSFGVAHLIIGGGFIEELLEELQKRADIDEYVSIDDICSIKKREIHLCIREDELMKTDASGNLPAHLIKFSKIFHKKVIDPSGVEVGEIIDLEFREGKTYLVVIDLLFNRTMQRNHGFGQRVEFILDTSKIEFSDLEIRYLDSADTREKVMLKELTPQKRGYHTLEI